MVVGLIGVGGSLGEVVAAVEGINLELGGYPCREIKISDVRDI